jgi:hypothetical protein
MILPSLLPQSPIDPIPTHGSSPLCPIINTYIGHPVEPRIRTSSSPPTTGPYSSDSEGGGFRRALWTPLCCFCLPIALSPPAGCGACCLLCLSDRRWLPLAPACGIGPLFAPPPQRLHPPRTACRTTPPWPGSVSPLYFSSLALLN